MFYFLTMSNFNLFLLLTLSVKGMLKKKTSSIHLKLRKWPNTRNNKENPHE